MDAVAPVSQSLTWQTQTQIQGSQTRHSLDPCSLIWPLLYVPLTSQLQKASSSVLVKDLHQRNSVLRELPFSSPSQGTPPMYLCCSRIALSNLTPCQSPAMLLTLNTVPAALKSCAPTPSLCGQCIRLLRTNCMKRVKILYFSKKSSDSPLRLKTAV